ncbi:UNVERIFIED_CONTAM: hypothetical protein Sradi_1201100 [Sesamum radiatum]|uniref:Leucine-rich repeat-containing N-terminal plant-type domain-containing protein n=1 Tax=Sesamum radiatum TaxID=300843 RepID=A0AAW2UL36_SESRA
MDHQSPASSQALPWLLLMLLLPVTAIFPMVYCQQTEIDCLRSIKESLEDPIGKLSAWDFNNISGNGDLLICDFPGIECWGRFQQIAQLRNLLKSFQQHISGEIPPGIADCLYLNILQLNSNLLTGGIPAGLVGLNRLVAFTVVNNILSGPLPEFLYTQFPPESYANNAGLCGEPLDPCAAHDSRRNQFMS